MFTDSVLSTLSNLPHSPLSVQCCARQVVLRNLLLEMPCDVTIRSLAFLSRSISMLLLTFKKAD